MKFKIYNNDEEWVFYNKADKPIEIRGDIEMAVEGIALCNDDSTQVEIEVYDTEPSVGDYTTLVFKRTEGDYAIYMSDDNIEEIFPMDMLLEISNPIPHTLYCDWI